MGLCLGSNSHQRDSHGNRQPDRPIAEQQKVSKVQQVDMVKAKLKVVRDKIQTLVNRKQIEREEVNREMLQKYQKTKNKKDVLPLLNARKELDTFLQNTQSRMTVINKALRDVEMQQLDANIVGVLDESNKYMAKVQQELEDKNWRDVVAQAQQKYEGVEWNAGQEEDEDFKKLWHELGGDKLDQQEKAAKVAPTKEINRPKVVEVPLVQQEDNNKQILLT